MTHTLHRTDEELAEHVRAAIRDQSSLAGVRMLVVVNHGSAILYGRAQQETQADLAERIAWSVDGIVAVAQEMFVSAPATGATSKESKS